MSDPFLSRAKTLIGQGNPAEARRLLQEYLALYANNAEAWLLLAALSTPRASLDYIQRALALDPQNPVAHEALKWAQARLTPAKLTLELPAVAAANPEPQRAPLPIAAPPPIVQPQPRSARHSWSGTGVRGVWSPRRSARRPQPRIVAQPPAKPPRTAPNRESTTTQRPTHVVGYVLRSFPFLVVAFSICLLTGFIIINYSRASQPGPRAAALAVDFAKSTFTPTSTPTNTSTNTPTATATSTSTFTSTSTPTPSATATETPTATPTDTPTPTETPSPTFTPTSTGTACCAPTLTSTAPLSTLSAPTSTSVVGNTGRWIEVNLSTQTLTAYEGDAALNTFPVSSGKWSTPTLPGTFHVYIKLRIARMVGFDYDTPDVPYVMYYDGNYGIHGAYWHNSFGTPVSHGCVNLRVPDAAWLFNFASVGTQVKIHY